MYVNWFNNICDVFISYNTKRFDKNQIFLYYYFVITINFRIYDNYFSQVSEQYQRSLEDIVLNNKDKKDTIEYSVERIDAKLKRYR